MINYKCLSGFDTDGNYKGITDILAPRHDKIDTKKYNYSNNLRFIHTKQS